MSYSGSYYRPSLKNSVDVQLQNAFGDGNWATVVRLADKRAKATNDPYFEVVKACAATQLEGPLERHAALVSIDSFVRKGTVLKDADALELYEWALRDLAGLFSYSQTLGAMRSRWVKANPRSPAALQCLRACIQNWDLVNAQQIAAILDKTPGVQRQFMYWNIVLTYMLSNSEQCPKEKQKIYGMLAMKQLERAAELTESNPNKSNEDNQSKLSDRGLRTDEEIVFYYRLLASQSAPAEFLAHMRSPVLGALKQFEEGRKHLLMEALKTFEKQQQWAAIFEFCLHALSKEESDGSPSFLAADLVIWKSLISAAAKMSNPEERLSLVQSRLVVFASAMKSQKVPPMYRKNIGLALLELTFKTEGSGWFESGSSNPMSTRVAQLGLFLQQYGHEISAFDDVKGFIEVLSFEETRCLLDEVLMKRIYTKHHSPHIATLYVKLRYHLTTSPHSVFHDYSEAKESGERLKKTPTRCKYCSAVLPGKVCQDCIRQVAKVAMELHAVNNRKQADETPNTDRDPTIDLALVAAMCLLKLSGLESSSLHLPVQHQVDFSLFLQAVAILDNQLQKTPDQPPLRLLLSRLYIVLGCASYSHQIWLPLGVKRTIHDSLSPLFFDRISTISPGLFVGSRPPMEPLRTFYSYTLRDPSPVKIWDAFDSGSYSSVLEITDYCERLRHSCTLIMTVVEERRVARALGGRLDNLEDISFLGEIYDHTTLFTTLDVGSVMNLESSHTPAPLEQLGVGPPPSNTRSHLELLAEKFLQLCDFTPSKDYKPAKPAIVAEQDLRYILETLTSLHESFTNFLHLGDTSAHLTRAEEAYYTILTLWSGLMSIAVSTSRSEDLTLTAPELMSAILATVSTMKELAFSTSLPKGRKSTMLQISSPHAAALLRETAVALKSGASFVLSLHEQAQARDRSGKSSLHKDVVAQMKEMAKVATEVLNQTRDHFKFLKSELGETGWLDDVVNLTIGESDDLAAAVLATAGGRANVENWAGKMLDSWREGVKGWIMVKTD
ncbi:hypothetical protein MCOR02_005172 [Pyricularia oryzae]|uniref:N-acetyltransferase B complex non catalytic subunit n=1 Tax=Pyricularia oryzae TaxID=318829 RepID=A0A4P7MVT5_PYROR|nr:hypothetical protein MCOR02_005172 [Pyricularia oryzae]KAI6309226.1 hypothetical protein MCOR34_006896 [Pyricularia oryzae]KAI6493754.1 hypothetical protein MCOR13_007749 [Pyricularia oryzae]KAI6579020.1 hypothetical protein MCOR04_006205 [Pyricularia oryzae]KAI6645064.1 hypothetical protein MCOR14_000513 [Pyricularia oryzae]